MSTANSTPPSSGIARLVFYGLQPALLTCVIGIWLMDPSNLNTYLWVLLLVQIILGLAEHFFPARNEWLSSARVKMRNIVIVTLLLFVSGAVNALYHLWLAAPLAQLRADLNLDIWPHSWPLVVQLFLCSYSANFSGTGFTERSTAGT